MQVFAGLALVAAGVALFVIEAHAPGLGLAGATGAGAVILGALLVFNPGRVIFLSPLALLVGAIIAIIVLGAVAVIARRGRGSPTAHRDPVGIEGVTVNELAPGGRVRIGGEEWSAEAIDGPIPAGARVVVVERAGLRLRVTRF
jgi:membrane-bound serine protease (ClpP class)